MAPLRARLGDAPVADSEVVVHADTRPPVRGAWNVQVFHGLGDKGYTGNPLFLQRGRFPRARTALDMAARRLGRRTRLLEAPPNAYRRAGRYEQVNAYGPRFADHFEQLLADTVVSRHGHVALNERPPQRGPAGPVLWLPTWDNSAFLGGPNQSGLGRFADAVAGAAQAGNPVRVKLHPHTVAYDQEAEARARLASAGVEVVPADADVYALLDGARAVLTDTSSLGFEAACAGLPVAVARPADVGLGGLHAELEQRVPVLAPDDVEAWMADPEPFTDTAWARDLLFAPRPERNDAFAAELAARAGRSL